MKRAPLAWILLLLSASRLIAGPNSIKEPCKSSATKAQKLITFGNGNFSLSLSSEDGRIYSLKSLQPSPLELLRDAKPLGVYGVTQEGKSFAFDHVKAFQVMTENGSRVGAKIILEGNGVSAELACRVEKPEIPIRSGKESLLNSRLDRDLRLTLTLKRVAATNDVPRLIFLGQPDLPVDRDNLYSFPYSEGIASSGAHQFFRLGAPSWEAKVHTREKFAAPCTIEASLTIKDGEAGVVYALQPTEEGYYITFRDGKQVTCHKNSGGWITEGSGLGSRPFHYENGKIYQVKIYASEQGFSVFVGDEKLFDVQDTRFTEGSVGLFTNWLGVALFHQVRVLKEGKPIFKDDFSSYPIGSEASPDWDPGSNYGWVPGYISIENGGNEWGGYPARFVDLSDRYLAWGQFDLAHPVILNRTETTPPWMAIGPLPQDGTPYSFNLFLKCFSKTDFAPRDRIRWYAERMYSSDSFFPRGEPHLKHTITRTLPEGNTIWYMWGLTDYLKKYNQAPPCLLRAEERARSLAFKNIVLIDWYSLAEAGASPDDPGAHLQLSSGRITLGKRLKEEILRLQESGFRVYLYCWPITLAFNPRDKVKLERFITFVKESVKFYEPDGVGYDMNWDVHKEILKLQYEIYRWLHEKFPGKKVIVDYGYGTASELCADAHLCENTPPAYGFPENSVVEATAALRATLLNLIYFQSNARSLQKGEKLEQWGWGIDRRVDSMEQHKAIYVELVLKSLALGAPWTTELEDFVSPEDVDDWEKMKGVRPCPFPELIELKRLADFSSLATGTPLVAEARAIQSHPDVVASCWAMRGRLLIAAYRHKMTWHPEAGFWSPEQEATSKLVWLKVKLGDLKKYGLADIPQSELVVLDKNGLPAKSVFKVESKDLAIKYPASSLEVSSLPPFEAEIKEGALKITGYLGKDEMLLMYPRQNRSE